MAQNEALQFMVRVVEDPNHGVDALVKQIAGKLNSITFNLKGDNINIQGLQQALQKAVEKIKPMKVVDSKSLNDTVSSIKSIETLLNNAFAGFSGSKNPFAGLLRSIVELRNQLEGLSNAMNSLGGKLSENIANSVLDSLTKLNGAFKEAQANAEKFNAAINGDSKGRKSAIDNISKTALDVQKQEAIVKQTSEIEKASKSLSKANKETFAANRKEADAAIKSLQGYYKTLNQLQQEGLQKSANKDAYKDTFGYKEIEQAKRELQQYIETLREAKRAGQSISQIDLGKFGNASTAEAHMNNLAQAQQNATRSAQDHTYAQERMAQAIQKANQQGALQSQVLGDLKSMATQYLSVWGASSLVKEIANITGELELQQRSLEVILGSAGQAQELFGNIKSLSQMSPYTFQDLLKSTRQLAAFGVETKDLYGTMKSLSDLGAGLNVDVQRLILAYGHVKSAGVLSGIQRRQFETAGINITGEIAKLYNQRYRDSGSAERVTTADIFKRITKRDIGFEDVQEAIKNLTSEGGKFYNMQLRQYETLGGKLRNLRNNYNIMLDEIGKSYMNLFVGGVDAMNSMMENWRTWGKLIKDVVAALVAAKVASMALGKGAATHRLATATQMSLYGERALIFGANTRNTMIGPATTGKAELGRDYAKKINESNMSRFSKINAALYANVSKEASSAILAEQHLNKAYQSRIEAMKRMANSTNSVRAAYGKMRLGIERMTWSANNFFNTMRTGFASLLANPMVWIGAVVAGFSTLVQKGNEIEEQGNSIRKGFGETLRSDIDSMKSELDNYKELLGFSYKYYPTDKEGIYQARPVVDAARLGAEGAAQVIENLDAELQKFDPLYKGHLLDIGAMQGEANKVATMIDTLQNAQKAKDIVANQAGAIASAVESTGYQGSWDNLFLKGIGKWDSVLDEMKEFQQEYNEIVSQVEANEDVFASMLRRNPEIHPDLSANEQWVEAYRKGRNEIIKIAEENGLSYSEAFRRYLVSGNLEGVIDENGKKIKASFLAAFDGLKESYGSVGDSFDINTNKFVEKVSGVKKKLAPVIAQMKSGLNQLKDTSNEMKGAYIAQFLDSFFSTEGYEVSGEAREALTQIVLEELSASLTKGLPEDKAKEIRDNIFAQIFAGSASTDATDFINNAVRQGLVNVEGLTDEQINTLREKFFEGPLKKAVAGRTPFAAMTIKAAYEDALNKAIEKLKGSDLKGWQRQIRDALELTYLDDIKFQLGINISSKSDISEVITETQKKFAEIKKIVTETFGRSLKSVLNITIDPALSFSSLAGIQALRKQIIASLKAKWITKGDGLLDFKVNSAAFDMANQVLKLLDTMEAIFKIGDATGFDTVGRNKDAEKAAKAAEKEAEKRKRAQEKAAREAEAEERRQWNKRIENLRQQISMINEVRSEYKKWEKDLSKSSALEMVKKNFMDRGLYGVGKIFEPGDLDNAEDFASVLAKVEKKIKDLKAATKDKDRKDQLDGLLKDVAKAASDNAYLIFSEGSEKYLRDYGRQLDELTRKWERYNSVIEKTGDSMDGMRLSGLDEYSTGNLGFYADDLANWANGMFATSLSTTTGAMRTIDFEHVAGLDDEGIEEYAKKLLGNLTIINEKTGETSTESAQKVQSLIKVLKEYKRAITDLDKRSIDAFGNASASAMDYASQVKRINAELKIQEDLINRLNGISAEEKAFLTGRLKARAEWDKHERSNDYSMMMNNNAGMNPEEFYRIFEETRRLLLERLKTGDITSADYTKSMEELLSKRSDYQRDRFSAYLDFDPVNRMERAFKEAMTEFQRASEKYQAAQTAYENANNRLAELQGLQTQAINTEMQARDYDRLAEEAEAAGDHEGAMGYRAEAEELHAKADSLKIQANQANIELKKLNAEVPLLQARAESAQKEVEEAGGKVEKTKNKGGKEKDTRSATEKAIKYLNQFSEALDFVSNALKSFGVDSAAAEDASTVAKSTSEGASVVGGISSALGAAGPYGAAAGAVLGLVSGLFQIHDAALQRQIEDIKFNTEQMKNTLESIKALRERELGYDSGRLRRDMSSMYEDEYLRLKETIGAHKGESQFKLRLLLSSLTNPADVAMYNYYTRYSKGSGYEQELELLKKQRENAAEMYNLEMEKKDSSQEELENYKKQMAELDEQIMFYVEDLANELWGIDLKGWSDQLSDALMTAFENGESAAGAFKDTVQDIMRSMVRNMLTIGVIEPAFDSLRERLFGKNGEGGLFNYKDPKGSMGAVISELGNWFKNEGPQIIDAANEFYTGADDMLRQTLGYGLRTNERGSNTADSLSSVASEETMGVVAGYLSRLSQDVSVQRIMQEMFVNGSWPDYIEMVTGANNSLTAIDRSTTAMMEMMRDGNGALYERVENMSRRLDNFANGIDVITVK